VLDFAATSGSREPNARLEPRTSSTPLTEQSERPVLSFALKTLLADRGKLLTGLAGVVFSLVLMNVQGGLYLGLMRKASLLVDHCDADFWVGQRMVEDVDLARDIPEAWMNRLRGVPGVECVVPYVVGKGTATLADGRMEDVWVVGSDPATTLGSGWNFVAGSQRDLRRPNAVSFDEVDARKLGYPRVGDWLEVNGHRARLAAQTRGVSGFITMPYLFTTVATAQRLSNMTPGYCSFFLVKARAGEDAARLLGLLQKRVPDAVVYTPPEFAAISQDYWMKRTGIGISFGASTLLGLLVGLMMVGQSLYALALDHLSDFATLKALGAEDRHVCRVILLQSLAVATTGSAAGIAIVLAIRKFWSSPLAPLEIPPALIVLAVGFVFVICLAASLLPYVRIRRIDPAVVLQG
jgi:putative ABC transport system permease protein